MKVTFNDLLLTSWCPCSKWVPRYNYVQRKLHKLWLFYKGKGYAARRSRIIFNLEKKRGKRRMHKMMVAEFTKKSFLLEKILKDDVWRGSTLAVPFKMRDK